MSEIEDKVLGREIKTAAAVKQKNYFGSQIIWQVCKKGCGPVFFNGSMVYEMLTSDGKQKARKGVKKLEDGEFVFERCSKGV